MSHLEMQVVPIRDKEQYQFVYEIEVEVSSSNPISHWILVPGGIQILTCSFIPSNDDTFGAVQTVCNKVEKVKAGVDNDLDIFTWTEGNTNAWIQTSFDPVSAFRLYWDRGTGTIKLSVRAQ